MKNITPELLAFLQTRTSCGRASLFLIELANGQVITATTAQSDVLFGDVNQQRYYPSKFGAWEHGAITSEVSYVPRSNTMSLTVAANSTVVYPGTQTPLMETIGAGLFDKALVRVYEIFWPIDGRPADGIALGYLTAFVGEITKIVDLTQQRAQFDCADMLYRLNTELPLNIIQSSCRHSLFNPNCGLNRADFAFNNTAAPGSNALVLNLNNDVTTATYWNGVITFAQGAVYFTTGQNAGLWGYIKEQQSTTCLLLAAPMPFPVVTGTGFIMYPGCNLTLNMCDRGFHNLINNGSTPFVPSPELAV